MIRPQDRRHAVDLINKAVADGARAVKACQCLNLAYSTYRKWMNDPDGEDGRPRAIHAPNSKALCIEEKKAVLERYCHPDVCDLSIRQAYYKLLDDGEYLASESTVYRIFRKSNVNVRRDGSRAPVKRNKPTSFEATGPNQVWSWDITYLKDAKHKQRFYYVFAIVDIYSRFVVHADVYDNEGTDNAKQFLETAFKKHHIKPRALVLHSDNGAAMKAAETLAVLQKYKVRQSNSRPRVSNDNPYSESLFKTMKYRGLMGKRQYRSIDDAKDKLKKFVTKYNTQWVHSGINNVTPLCRFLRQDDILQKRRQAVIQSARKRHPCRWIQGQGKQFKTAGSQFLNPDKPKTLNETTSKDRLIDRDFTSGQASQREVAA